jgi:hypothetical protein
MATFILRLPDALKAAATARAIRASTSLNQFIVGAVALCLGVEAKTDDPAHPNTGFARKKGQGGRIG